MDNNVPQIQPNDQNVIITIPKSKMKEFIGDVLKTKRRIGKRYNVVFNLSKDDIVDIIQVIQHRIKEQNEADIVDLSIDVLYDDGSNREYKGIEQFITVDDNLKAVSVACIITMSYLVRFNGDEFPTQNEIRIAAMSSSSNLLSGDLFAEANIRIFVETNKFTWAEDIINNFTNYIEGKFNKPDWIYRTFRLLYMERPTSNFVVIIILTGLFLFLIFYLREMSFIEAARWRSQASLLAGDTLQAANQKLDFLIERRAKVEDLFFEAKPAIKYLMYSIAYLLFTVVTPLVYMTQSNNSYTSIGRVSLNKNNARIKKANFIKVSVFMGSLISVVLGIFSSYLYDTLKVIFD